MRSKCVLLFVVLLLAGIVILSGCVSEQPTSPATTVPTAFGTQQTPVSGNQTVKPTVTITIPANGVFLKVSYLGSFSGTYGVNGVMEKVRNSGDRLYEITDSAGNFTATFNKEDGSTKHDIIVELWKNGRSVTSAKNATPFGKVSINYTL